MIRNLERVVDPKTKSQKAAFLLGPFDQAEATADYTAVIKLKEPYAPLLAYATTDLGRALLSVAALGFLGLGAPPPRAEWGQMLFEGRGYLSTAPWTSLTPGLAIALTVLGVTLLGDALGGER